MAPPEGDIWSNLEQAGPERRHGETHTLGIPGRQERSGEGSPLGISRWDAALSRLACDCDAAECSLQAELAETGHIHRQMSYRGPTNSLASIGLASLGTLAIEDLQTCIAFSSDIWRPVSQSEKTRGHGRPRWRYGWMETEATQEGAEGSRSCTARRCVKIFSNGVSSLAELELAGEKLLFFLLLQVVSLFLSRGADGHNPAHPCKEQPELRGRGTSRNITGQHSIDLWVSSSRAPAFVPGAR